MSTPLLVRIPLLDDSALVWQVKATGQISTKELLSLDLLFQIREERRLGEKSSLLKCPLWLLMTELYTSWRPSSPTWLLIHSPGVNGQLAQFKHGSSLCCLIVNSQMRGSCLSTWSCKAGQTTLGVGAGIP